MPVFPFIDIGFMTLHTYWVMALLGFTVGIAFIFFNNKHHPHYRLPVQDLVFLMVYAAVGVILGARLVFIFTFIPQMIQTPAIIPHVLLSGGMVFYGGVIGGVLMGYLYVRQYGLDPIKFANLFAVSIPIGHAFGRVGCFMAGCCHGRPTDSIFGVVFPKGPLHPEATEAVHPTQLYEVAFNTVLFIVMLVLFYKYRKKHKPYVFAAMYLIGYGVFRFFNEFLRGDEIRGVYILSTSQFISLFIVAFGCFLLLANVERFKPFRQNPPTSKSYKKHLESKNQASNI